MRYVIILLVHLSLYTMKGSKLSGIFFAILIDGIGEAVQHSRYLLYADDFKLFRIVSDENDSRLLQEDLDAVTKWLNKNELEFSIKKCDVMTITRKKSPCMFQYKINDSILERVNTKKDLGVTFQTNLKFENHIAETCKKAFQTLGMIFRHSNFFQNIDTLRLLYTSLVRSKLEYATVIWAPKSKSYVSLLENVQAKFLRSSFKKENGFYPTYPNAISHKLLAENLDLQSLEDRRRCAFIMLLYNIMNSIVDVPSAMEYIFIKVPPVGLRQREDPAFFSSGKIGRSPIYSASTLPTAMELYNEYSSDLDFVDPLGLFKERLRGLGLSNEKLRDEILCQLVNQTWRNDNTASCERGWLLMANCLSVFPPSAPLYKFLLKYVSDHAYNGYKQICQRKLLQSHNQWARSCPPSLLEWRANRKRVNMALQLNFADGESIMTGVDSWSRCENLCSAVLAERGVAECHGWTISMERSNSKTADHRNGLDYILDPVSEMELSPQFPVTHRSGSQPVNHKMSSPDVEPVSRRPTVPPPQPPPSAKMVKEKARSVSRDHSSAEPMGLSRQSALNDRYFDPNGANGNSKQGGGRSRSLDNLLTPRKKEEKEEGTKKEKEEGKKKDQKKKEKEEGKKKEKEKEEEKKKEKEEGKKKDQKKEKEEGKKDQKKKEKEEGKKKKEKEEGKKKEKEEGKKKKEKEEGKKKEKEEGKKKKEKEEGKKKEKEEGTKKKKEKEEGKKKDQKKEKEEGKKKKKEKEEEKKKEKEEGKKKDQKKEKEEGKKDQKKKEKKKKKEKEEGKKKKEKEEGKKKRGRRRKRRRKRRIRRRKRRRKRRIRRRKRRRKRRIRRRKRRRKRRIRRRKRRRKRRIRRRKRRRKRRIRRRKRRRKRRIRRRKRRRKRRSRGRRREGRN
ncbi:hypothetical protein M8J77_006381 [Diaphorina citri]|nr:hypothetical protein M8J77_006381 [Diaphorina citri]